MRMWILWAALIGMGMVGTVFAQSLSSVPADVPLRPDPALTPGALCQQGNTRRYPEKIRYCERDVESEEKDQVFFRYSQKYSLQKYNRHQFKIDHYVPLCMGGGNEPGNLWPQHLSISVFTDKIEDLLCKGMRLGKIRQAAAIEVMRRVKFDLGSAGQVREQLEATYGP